MIQDPRIKLLGDRQGILYQGLMLGLCTLSKFLDLQAFPPTLARDSQSLFTARGTRSSPLWSVQPITRFALFGSSPPLIEEGVCKSNDSAVNDTDEQT